METRLLNIVALFRLSDVHLPIAGAACVQNIAAMSIRSALTTLAQLSFIMATRFSSVSSHAERVSLRPCAIISHLWWTGKYTVSRHLLLNRLQFSSYLVWYMLGNAVWEKYDHGGTVCLLSCVLMSCLNPLCSTVAMGAISFNVVTNGVSYFFPSS